MTSPLVPVALAVTLAATLAAFAGCYHGKDNVPLDTTSSGAGGGGTTATTGLGGASATSSSTTGSAGTGGQGGSAGTGGADPCTTALLCDDFESYALGAPPGGKWTNNQNGGTVTVDSTHVHSGSKAVKMSAATATGYRSVMISLADKTLLPASGGVVYGRMMFWLDSAPVDVVDGGKVGVHWTFIAGSGLVPGQTYHAVYRYGGQNPLMNSSQLMASYDTPDSYPPTSMGPSTDCWLHANTEVVPVATWTCAEWMFDTPHNTMRFWQNGTELKDLAMTGTGQGCVHQTDLSYVWAAPAVDTLDLGMESYQADDARNIWIDDVGIGTQRLGCPP